ncbi:hypothetical protein Clacol_002904 [Clathrus columnatus]|uniref:ATP synthase subunit e, mitochondrial n=1 Tax=Clathrus columnatus TaxID=1419009 RepID=A0AAV5A358_9AGAM|nr:hypothetical protein Clacol_002904 [Clathrus columnatus]
MSDLPAHASYMVGFGILGYYADIWEKYSGELIAQKREMIRQNRIRLAEEAEKADLGAKERVKQAKQDAAAK